MSFNGSDVISIRDLSREEILKVLDTANELERRDCVDLMRGRILGTLFFEASTRTRLSFETSMYRLGGSVIGFAEAGATSAKKGESLWDTIKTVEGYVDLIVIRHPTAGSARLAAEASGPPVINAGDGANQHPTQTLLDLYTIRQVQGRLDDLRIAMVGDLKYGRTVHSLTDALMNFGSTFHFVSPESLRMPLRLREELEEKGISYSEHRQMEEIIQEVDILYMTRIQRERFPDAQEYEKVSQAFLLNRAMLKDVRANMKVMHPLPRVSEIAKDVDPTEFAHYFQQAHNGIPVRKAIIALLSGVVE